MNADGLCSAPLSTILDHLRRRAVSPLELVDAYLERIQRARPLSAFITVTAESAKRKAREAERRLRDGQDAPLLGAPLAIKDLFQTRGVRTTAGSRILRDWVPDRDAATVARLHEAGAISLGKLNLHEFAYGVTNDNPHWGTARHPADAQRIPGGSSGGSAIAVVAGLCAASIGTDTGGSIRIPAALCGCVGLKPTYQAVPTEGIVPLAHSLDHAGPITRTVEDAAIMLSAMTGRRYAPSPVKGMRLGVLAGFGFNRVDAGVVRMVQGAVGRLREGGLRVRPVNIPELTLSVATQLVTIRAEASANHLHWIRRRPRSYGRDVRIRLQLGAMVTAREYLLAQRARAMLREAVLQAFEKIDLLALPTVPIVAPRIGERTVAWRGGREPVDGALVRLTSPFNLTGLPALSVPCGSSRGLPVGLQLVAPWGEEPRLLGAGRLLEETSAAEQLTQ